MLSVCFLFVLLISRCCIFTILLLFLDIVAGDEEIELADVHGSHDADHRDSEIGPAVIVPSGAGSTASHPQKSRATLALMSSLSTASGIRLPTIHNATSASILTPELIAKVNLSLLYSVFGLLFL